MKKYFFKKIHTFLKFSENNTKNIKKRGNNMKILQLKNTKIIQDPSEGFSERVPYYYAENTKSENKKPSFVLPSNRNSERKESKFENKEKEFDDFISQIFKTKR